MLDTIKHSFNLKSVLTLLAILVQCGYAQVGVENTLTGLPGGDVIRPNFYMHTSMFTRLPNGEKPNFITNFRGDLVVTTRTKIFLINVDTKDITEMVDIDDEIKAEGEGRGIELGNNAHGGLRAVAFHPTEENLIYVSLMEKRPSNPSELNYLTNDPESKVDSVVAEFELSSDRKSVVPGSYRSVLRIGVPYVPGRTFYDHPIKTIAFRRRNLYIAHGDASDQVASSGGGQSNDAFGKILRINPLKRGSSDYRVPGSNPFINDDNMLNEVWALGLRNPHHICFGRSRRLYIGETGRFTSEEINLARGGENFGWALREGPFVFNFGPDNGAITELPEDDADFGFTYPSAALGHISGGPPQALGAGCPIENNSPMKGLYPYFDFPVTGNFYVSSIDGLFSATTRGDPDELTRARTYQPYLCYHQDDGSVSQVENLGEIIRDLDPENTSGSSRADVRMGRGPDGVVYWSSKINSAIYVVESSKANGDTSRC